MKVEIEFTEPLLGTMSGDENLTTAHILTKHPDGIAKDELEALDGLDKTTEKQSTIFARDKKGMPMLWDYQIKGFFKEACEAMIHAEIIKKEELKKPRLTFWMFKKTIDKQIFVTPRKIVLRLTKGCGKDKLKFCERPLRADTRKGPRIALARSEQAPAGTKIQIEIICMNKKLEDFIKLWLDYGALSGLGQWRNSGMGRFIWKEIKE